MTVEQNMLTIDFRYNAKLKLKIGEGIMKRQVHPVQDETPFFHQLQIS